IAFHGVEHGQGFLAGSADMTHGAPDEALAIGFDVLKIAPARDFLTEAVGVDPCHAREVHRYAQHVFLEQQDAVALAEHLLERGMPEGGVLQALAPAQVRVDRARLDGSWPDEGYLMSEIGEVATAHDAAGVLL